MLLSFFNPNYATVFDEEPQGREHMQRESFYVRKITVMHKVLMQ
jgi:hypothetical protein